MQREEGEKAGREGRVTRWRAAEYSTPTLELAAEGTAQAAYQVISLRVAEIARRIGGSKNRSSTCQI